MRRVLLSLAACGLLWRLASSAAWANLITDPSQMNTPQTVIDFSQFTGGNQYFAVTGPIQIGGLVGKNVTASSATSDLYLYNGYWGLAANGHWDSDRVGFVGIFPDSGPVRLTFNDGPVSGVGGFVNYAFPAGGLSMAVFDSSNTLLETFNISTTAPIITPDQTNAGAFRGIQRDQADIAYVEFTGFGAVVDDLRFTESAIPEPASLTLFGLGAVGVVVYACRRKQIE